MTIKAILFDMDGVIIDAKEWHYKALNKALSHFGIQISIYDHLRTFDGLPTKEKLKILSCKHFLPSKLHPFINELKQKYTMEMINTLCHPTYCHEFVLSRLKAEGYRIAVCSNSIRRTIETMMERAALTGYLDLIVSNQDVKRSKPDPEMYQVAIKKLGLQPKECVVEDNPNGVAAGRAAGAYVLQVGTVFDVNYKNIKDFVRDCEEDY